LDQSDYSALVPYPTSSIEIPELPVYKKIEEVAADHFYKQGYSGGHFENTLPSCLFILLGFDFLYRIPDWNKYDKEATIYNYPELLDHLDKSEVNTITRIPDMPLRIAYSFDVLKASGEFLYFGFGIEYQMFKEKIDTFVSELTTEKAKEIIVINYERLIVWGSQIPHLFAICNRDPEQILPWIDDIPITMLKLILHYNFLNNYRYRVGYPDLWLVKDGLLKLVEVKRIREKVSPIQEFWLNEFNKIGIDTSLLRVRIKNSGNN